ncbi:MAG: ABC transporter permease [Chitinophagaceae bacterium]|nr:MAG: ABC transporter permease [Chitinophagaceae bacterium]
MKQFVSFVKKEFYHILRDRRTLFILLAMPIVQIIIFGFALSNEVKNTRVVIFDQSGDQYTRRLTDAINNSLYFDVVASVHSYPEIEKLFKKSNIKLAIVFPANFRRDLGHFNTASVQLINDASDPNVATTITNYATGIIRDFQNNITNNSKIPYSIKTEQRMLYNPQLKAAYNFVPGVMAMVLMLVCTMMTAITIVREKETGTMEILLVSPIQPFRIILAKATPYLLLSMVNIMSILLLSVFVLGVPINGSLLLLLMVSVLFTLTCLAFGLLISSSTDSQQTAMFISLTGMFLPTLMLSGFMFPIENMPVPLQAISNVVPARWYYSIVKDVMIKGAGFSAIWQETLILTAMLFILLGISIKKFKIRLA